MKSQRYYRISNDKFWRILGQRASDPFRCYKKGLKYGDDILASGYFVSQTWGALHKKLDLICYSQRKFGMG
ncbi:MAG TPA: hypothetical protein VFP49_05205 [Nitrososphaeraceae archaeon]|nr:hypothetical protein [Nitrososphaeraceae archaeon]